MALYPTLTPLPRPLDGSIGQVQAPGPVLPDSPLLRVAGAVPIDILCFGVVNIRLMRPLAAWPMLQAQVLLKQAEEPGAVHPLRQGYRSPFSGH